MTLSAMASEHARENASVCFPSFNVGSSDALVQLGEGLKQRSYSFTTVSPATHRRVNAREHPSRADDLNGVFGWSRPFERDLLAPSLLGLMRAANVLDESGNSCSSLLRASTLDKQLYLHSAYPTLAHDAVFFGPDTYRFVRSLRQAMKERAMPVERAADIGCGAGPGAITVALAHPQATVFAIDINQAALALTEVNARLAGAHNVTAVRSDLLTEVPGQLDLIVANPPYLLDREQRAYRHGGGDLGAALSVAIVNQALARLSPGGTLMLYTGVAMQAGADPFLAAIEPILRDAHFTWSYEEIDPDVFGEELDQPAYGFADRIAAVWLCATKPLAQCDGEPA